MHFSKTYTELLANLPPELRDNAIQYRQLKKLINQVVSELTTLGLSPTVLHKLLAPSDALHVSGRGATAHVPKVVYELDAQSERIEPRLRLWITADDAPQPGDATPSETPTPDSAEEDTVEPVSEAVAVTPFATPTLLWALQRGTASEIDTVFAGMTMSTSTSSTEPREIVIPLISDTAFFQLLSTALQALSSHLLTAHSDFVTTLRRLARQISDSARPVSATTSFHPHGSLSNPEGVSAPLRSSLIKSHKNDLYSWREIFQLYIEAEVFESVSETSRGERPIEESEHRLTLFAERVSQRGLGDTRKLHMKESRAALETFLGLNVFILNVKKFQLANAEATRKILKKHAKRTALPMFPSSGQQRLDALALISPTSAATSLPHMLVQAIGETLLPIIPTVEDYECLICTSIAFKPIRLFCGHLFCVRCLVKMQKRGQGDCPMCRAPTVLVADRSNVDWALLNFMQDWFPDESREKLKNNEKEAAQETLIELGLDPDQKCVIM